MDKLKLWEEQVNNLRKILDRKLSFVNCRIASGIDNGELQQVDDSLWSEMNNASTWTAQKAPVYLRKKIFLPAEIEGIKIENSSVDLNFVFPSGVELFINGESVYSHKYWADIRATPFPLLKKLKTPEEKLIVFKVAQLDGMRFFSACVTVSNIENIFFQLNSILYQVRFAFKIAEKKKSLRRYAEEALEILNPDKIAYRRWDEAIKDIEKIENILEAFRKHAREFRVHLIGHAHIDMNWLWGYEDTVDVCLRDFKTVNRLMDKYPGLTFSQSQAQVYRIVEDNDRALFNKVRQKIKEGRWDVTASSWVEGDLNISCGESIARHLLYAGKYAEEKLGAENRVFWSPDTFGHPATIPSILAGAGLKYYYFTRCGKGRPLFRWQGPDGKEILAFNSLYINHIAPETLFPEMFRCHDSCGLSDFMFVYGVGDHGGGPTEADIRMKYLLEQKPVVPELVFSTTDKYFGAIEQHRNKLPMVKEELNTIFEGCYTTHCDIKRENRECENLLLSLESLSAVAGLHGCEIPEKQMGEMWQKTMFNQFHDILDGSAIHSSYDYSSALADDVKNKAAALVKEAVQKIAPAEKSDQSFVFNPLGWERTAVINSLEERLCGYGYKTISSVKKGEGRNGKFVKPSEDEHENEFYRIRIDGTTGLIRELYDKKSRRDVLSPCQHIKEVPPSWWAEKAGNLLSVSWEKPHPMSAWIIGNIYRVDNLLDAETVETEETGGTITVKIKRSYMESTILQKIILYPGFPFIDFENEIDWRQQGNDRDGVPMLRVNFNSRMKNPMAFFEVPFGAVERECLPKEYPALRWAGFNSGNYWIALFNKDKHGYHVDGNNLSLTLLRNPYEPDSLPDSGLHKISYRLFFGKSDILGITRAAWEYDCPPLVVRGKAAAQEFFPFKIAGDVLPSSFKKTLGRDSYILRLVEVLGGKQKVEIECIKPVKKAYLTDIAERRKKKATGTKAKKISLNLNPFEILTLEMEF